MTNPLDAEEIFDEKKLKKILEPVEEVEKELEELLDKAKQEQQVVEDDEKKLKKAEGWPDG